jgi:curved DNA-binding protein CbpA
MQKMQNLYDLLGVRPDGDAETIKKAFRTAAKASHPDHHAGDPEAAARFRQISEAYEILRDAEQRAAYDRLLEFERRPLRHKVKRSVSNMKRHVVHDLMAGVLLAAVLAVGYELFVRVHETPGVGTAGVTTHESRQAAAGRDRREHAPAPQMPIAVPTTAAPTSAAAAANDRVRPQMADGEPVSNPARRSLHQDGMLLPQMADGEPVSNPAGQSVAVASRGGESDVPTGAGVPAKAEGEPPVRRDPPSHDAPSSAAEDRNGVPAAGERRDGKTPEKTPEKTPDPASASTGGAKPPETKAAARSPAEAKRHAPSRRPIEQAALVENRNTPAVESRNAQAPDSAPSRVFGVGF